MSSLGPVRYVPNPNKTGHDAGALDFAFSPDGREVVTVGTGAFFDTGTWLQTGHFNDAGSRRVFWLDDGRILLQGATLGELDRANGKRTTISAKGKYAYAPDVTLLSRGVIYGVEAIYERNDKPFLRAYAVDGSKVGAARDAWRLEVLEDAGDAGLFGALSWAHFHEDDGGRIGLYDRKTAKCTRSVPFPFEISTGARLDETVWLATWSDQGDADLVPVDRTTLEAGDPWALGIEGRIACLRPWNDLLVAATQINRRGDVKARAELLLLDPSARAIVDRAELTHPRFEPIPSNLVVGHDTALLAMDGFYVIPLQG